MSASDDGADAGTPAPCSGCGRWFDEGDIYTLTWESPEYVDQPAFSEGLCEECVETACEALDLDYERPAEVPEPVGRDSK